MVFTDSFFEEVGLSTHGYIFHKIERVLSKVEFADPDIFEQIICDKLDVFLHKLAVHPYETDGQTLRYELLLDLHGLLHHLEDVGLGALGLQLPVEDAGEVCVQALVPADELVGEGEAGHDAPLLEPEDGGEAAGEEDALHAGEGYESQAEGVLVRHPLEGPLRLVPDGVHRPNGLEEEVLPFRVLDVGLDQEGVHLTVHVLDHYLESVEGPRLRNLHLCPEVLQ